MLCGWILRANHSSKSTLPFAGLQHMQQCRRLEFSTIFVLSFDPNENIDVHGLKIQGSGYLNFLSKSLGVKAFREDCQVGFPYFGFYYIFINKCFEISLGRSCFRLGKVR
jgi:hypothetical protein